LNSPSDAHWKRRGDKQPRAGRFLFIAIFSCLPTTASSTRPTVSSSNAVAPDRMLLGPRCLRGAVPSCEGTNQQDTELLCR
jgi:hypothetical protein